MCMQYITWLSGWLLNFTENFSWFFFVCVFLMNIRLLEMAAILDGGWDVTHNLKVCHPKINSAQSFWTGDLNVTFLKTGIQKYIGRKKKKQYRKKNPKKCWTTHCQDLWEGDQPIHQFGARSSKGGASESLKSIRTLATDF